MRLPFVVLVLLAGLVAACGPAHRGATASAPVGSYVWAPGAVEETAGVTIRFPDWLDQWPALRSEAVAEIASAGYPPGWTVVVTVAQTEGRIGLLSSGETWPDQETTSLGWRSDNTSPALLPSADYEAANARCRCESGGPNALSLIQEIQEIQQGKSP